MSINDFPSKPPKHPIEVTGIWLDAHSGKIRVRAEICGKWRNVIEVASGDGHISHCVHPNGMLKAPLATELK